MGWTTRIGAGPVERMEQKKLNEQHDRDAKKLRAGDPQATAKNQRLQECVSKARREGR